MPADRQDLRRSLAALVRGQSGYFTAAQALSIGYSYQGQKFHADRGNWLRVDRGLFRLPEWPVGEHDDLVRWSLWSRNRAVVSHETALSVHDLGDVNPAVVHLTVPANFRSRAPGGIHLHRAELPPADIWLWEGFRIATPLRSLLDVAAGTLELDQLADGVRRALEQSWTTQGELIARAEELGSRITLRIERALRLGGML